MLRAAACRLASHPFVNPGPTVGLGRDYAIRAKDAPDPGPTMDARILVPFGVESSLSGVGRAVGPDNRLWYRRAFRLPSAWAAKRIWLRFDAVDWDTTVWVNGHQVGRHSGGDDSFAFDITGALVPGADRLAAVSRAGPHDLRSRVGGRHAHETRRTQSRA